MNAETHASCSFQKPVLFIFLLPLTCQNSSYFPHPPTTVFGILYVLNHGSVNHRLPGLVRILPFHSLIPVMLLQGKSHNFFR